MVEEGGQIVNINFLVPTVLRGNPYNFTANMVEEGGQIVNINFIFGLYAHNHFFLVPTVFRGNPYTVSNVPTICIPTQSVGTRKRGMHTITS